MPWDDLHEPKKSGKRGGGSQGGPGDKLPFDIPQIQIPKFKPSLFGLLLDCCYWSGLFPVHFIL